ncbi:MAG: NADH-quinone oxidoreductase subunit J [Proteobacteria bacterium]|nr:NADH-quinone oxidoreductase subunit J [Pseudomonadota bacterium]
MKEAVFTFFSLFTLLTAAGVILSRNVIYSAFNLVLCFFGLATLYLLWGATFISMIQILIYAGAIVVLFVFVVMLLNFEKPTEQKTRLPIIILASAGVWTLALILLRVLSKSLGEIPVLETTTRASVRTVSKLLFSQYLWPFEVLTVFLLALIVGIFVLARPEGEEAK